MVGKELASAAEELCVEAYRRAARQAKHHGIIVADTKFELGHDDNGQLILIDEVLTPDSSRFWPVDQYRPGGGQPSFDKQFLRDYLSSLDWPKAPPPPKLPAEIIAKTGARYLEALERITGATL